MSFQDKSIQCSDCGTTFTFSAGEQEQFASRGYTNEPKRCSPCREARKARQDGNNGNSYRPSRQMFPARCSECGKDTLGDMDLLKCLQSLKVKPQSLPSMGNL